MSPVTLAPPAEPTMLAVAIARLDNAVLTTLASHATTDEQHAIVQDVTAAYTAILTLSREAAS